MNFPFDPEIADDEQLGRALRQLWRQSGQGIYIQAAQGERDSLMCVAVMDEIPNEDQYWPVGAYMLESETETESK